jgi:hypothetical protein
MSQITLTNDGCFCIRRLQVFAALHRFILVRDRMTGSMETHTRNRKHVQGQVKSRIACVLRNANTAHDKEALNPH